MSSLSQATPLGYLPCPHVAFQEHAAHSARWPAMLSSKGSWGTCMPQGLTTFLPCAFTAHGLQKIAVTRTTVQLAPWATIWMAVGAEVAKAQPASILAAFMRAKV